MSQAPGDQPAAGDAKLAQAWREATHEEPPAALDDAIRAAARQAVRAGPRPVGVSPFGGRWRVPLSVAALLVVSATVTLLVAERERSGSQSLREEAAPPPSMPVPPAQTGEPTTDLSRAPARQFAEPGAPPVTSSAPREREWEQAPEERKDSSPPAPPVASAGKLQASGQPAASPAPERPVSESARVETDNRDIPRTKSEQTQAANVAPAPAAVPPMAGADESLGDAAGIPVDEAAADLSKREEQTAARAKQRAADKVLPAAPAAMPKRAQQATAPQSEPRAVTAPSQAKASAEGAAAATTESLEPKAWLDRIIELRREGKVEEADKSLKAFRERYPGYPLPAELKSSP